MKQVFELIKPIDAIACPKDIFNKIKCFNIDFSQENLIVILLDCANKVLQSKTLFKGGLNSCVIDPRTIFRFALLHNANSLIIAHNHPSDNLQPSQEDQLIYETLKKGGEIIQIKVLDSIIFNQKEFYSMN